jgi:hypothetical protein
MQIQLETIESGRPPKIAKFFGAVARGVPYTTSGAPIVLSWKEKGDATKEAMGTIGAWI